MPLNSNTRMRGIKLALLFTCLSIFEVSRAATVELDLDFTVDDWRGDGEFAVDGTPGNLSITYDQSLFTVPPPPPPPSAGLTLNVADYVYSGSGSFSLDNGLQATGDFDISFFDYTFTTDAQRNEDIANNLSVTDLLYINAVLAAPNPGWGNAADYDLSFAFFFTAPDSFLFTQTPDPGYRPSLSDFASVGSSLFALSCDSDGNNCGGTNLMAFDVNGIEISAVPLPPALLLFVSGLVILLTTGKMRRKKDT